jgi:cytochrome c
MAPVYHRAISNYHALISLALVIASATLAATGAQPATSTVWDGVYTEPQAARGERLYRQRCTKCHRNDLSGDGALQGQLGEIVPSLVGTSFSSRWTDETVGDMSLTIGRTMPWDAPGTLTRQANVDIVSYLLKMNGIPAGASELPIENEKLQQILITSKPATDGRD